MEPEFSNGGYSEYPEEDYCYLFPLIESLYEKYTSTGREIVILNEDLNKWFSKDSEFMKMAYPKDENEDVSG